MEDFQLKLQQYLKDNKHKLSKGELKLYKSLATRKRIWHSNGNNLRLWESIKDKIFKSLAKEMKKVIDKEIMKLLMQNQALRNEIIQFEKHKVILNELIESDEFGSSRLNYNLVNGTLKRLRKYRIILEEM